MSKTPEHRTPVTIRIPADLKRRINDAINDYDGYRITLTSLIERGIELALKEIAKTHYRLRK